MVRGALAGAVWSAACVAAPDGTMPQADVPPWEHPAWWPYQLESPDLVVHYQDADDAAMAETVRAAVEDAWRIQIVEHGARPPKDGGVVGPDARFDVWLHRGIDTLYVTSTGADPATPYDDAFTAMVIDPWGRYGGDELAANLFHELRHGSQAVDDWNEHIAFFEAEATLWEATFYGFDRLATVWADYQAHPEWTPFRDDGYRTWFMYGGALFLAFLRDHVFAGDLAWTDEVWAGCRNPPGANEPDFADALATVLAAHDRSLPGELRSFARARWYTGAADDGSVPAGAILPPVARATHPRADAAPRSRFVARAQPWGTAYTVVAAAPADGATIEVSLARVDAGYAPVVQLVGQGAADRVLDLATGPVRVEVVDGAVALAVTMVPTDGALDPDAIPAGSVRATIALDR